MLFHTPAGRLACLGAATVLVITASVASAQEKNSPALQGVTISAKANSNPVEKSYRKMLRGMDLFERKHAMAPNAPLRFKLLPRQAGTDMDRINLEVMGETVDIVVPIAPDHTFTLERNKLAADENAQLIPNRKKQSMTWRVDIRTPGLPQDTRRLGDLRLECQVGMEAGLVSDGGGLLDGFARALMDTPAYCEREAPRYLFFTDRPLFSVTMVSGERRRILPVEDLYAGASDDPRLKSDLPICDCEVLVDRTYVLPLGDLSWPDDTRIEFEYMDAP